MRFTEYVAIKLRNIGPLISVLDCCQFFYPWLVSGGMMVFDDPGFADCAGAKIAVDEFFTDKEEFPIHLATGQVLVVKH